MLTECFEEAQAAFEGKPFQHYIHHEPIKYNRYRVLEDFEYDHRDQDIKHGVYHLKKGQIFDLHADEDPQYFMPDRSKLELICVVKRGGCDCHPKEEIE
jgi:hypothetical protein